MAQEISNSQTQPDHREIERDESSATKVRWRDGFSNLGSHVILLFFTILIAYPVVWMIMASFKTSQTIVTNPWGLPETINWESYQRAWEAAKLGRSLLNSTIVSAGTLLFVIGFSAPAGYAFAKFNFRFKAIILLIFIFTMQAPVPVIPFYVLFVKLGLTDSYLGLILAMGVGGLPLSIFIFQAFFRSIPSELTDAAKIDGCTELSAFVRVVLPISGPVLATIAILQFVGSWNEFFAPLLLVRSPEMRTLPLAVQVFFYAWGRVEWNEVFAALSIATVPIAIVYLILQRWFIQGMTAGAIKG